MISTHFVGARVYLRIDNHEFEIKVPYSLGGDPDAEQHCAEFLYNKLRHELEAAFEAGEAYTMMCERGLPPDAQPAPTFEEYLAGTYRR